MNERTIIGRGVNSVIQPSRWFTKWWNHCVLHPPIMQMLWFGLSEGSQNGIICSLLITLLQKPSWRRSADTNKLHYSDGLTRRHLLLCPQHFPPKSPCLSFILRSLSSSEELPPSSSSYLLLLLLGRVSRRCMLHTRYWRHQPALTHQGRHCSVSRSTQHARLL